MAALPVLRQSPTDPAFVQNPYPFYARARAAGPLVWWEDYELVCATRYDLVHALLRDARFGREQPTEMREPTPDHLAPFYAIEDHSMLEAEGDRHKRLRAQALRGLATKQVRALTPQIEALCQDLATALPDGPFDLLDHYCRPLPVRMICRVLGVPEQMADQLLAWSADMVAMYQARRDRAVEDAAAKASADFAHYLAGEVADRRKAPRDDLLSSMVAAVDDEHALSTDELIATCILLLNAGHEATVHALGNAVFLLLRDGIPVEASRIDATVEEALRLDPPLHLFTRYAYEPCDIAGHHFQRGDRVGLLLASAGRDDSTYAENDLFQPHPPRAPHVAFGGGRHFCIGAALARAEMAAALTALFDRHPTLRLADEPRYANLYHFHGLESLMVRVD